MSLHGIILIQLRHAHTSAPHLPQINIQLHPPRLTSTIVLESEIAIAGCSVQCCSGDSPRAELYCEHREHGVVKEGPRSVAEVFVVLDAEETHEVVELAVGLFELEVEA